MPVKPPASTAMFVSVARSSSGRCAIAVARELEHLADARRRVLKNGCARMWSITSFAQTPARSLPCRTKRAVSGTVTRTSLREPRVRHVGRADAEREAAERARHAGVRVGAGDELAGKRELLDDLVVADGLRADELSVAMNLAVELDAVLLREVVLHRRELARPAPSRPMSRCAFGMIEIEEREVIAEREDALGLGDRRVVAEARRGRATRPSASRTRARSARRCARRTRRRASPRGRRACPAFASTIACAARIFSQSVIGRAARRDRRRRDLAREARLVVREEPAVLDDVGADRIEPARELARSGSPRRARCARADRNRCS